MPSAKSQDIGRLREREQEAKDQGIRCPIPGCSRLADGVRRYCSRHTARLNRFGSPTQKAIRVHQLKPYRVTVRRFLRANTSPSGDDHPALTLVYRELDRWLSAGAAKAPTWPDPKDARGRLRFELGRLHRGGVTAKDIFEVVAALYLLSDSEPNTLPLGPELTYAMARAVLNLRPRLGYRAMSRTPGKGLRRVTTGTAKGVLETMGKYLLKTLLPVLYPMVATLREQRERQERQRVALVAAVEATPFRAG